MAVATLCFRHCNNALCRAGRDALVFFQLVRWWKGAAKLLRFDLKGGLTFLKGGLTFLKGGLTFLRVGLILLPLRQC